MAHRVGIVFFGRPEAVKEEDKRCIWPSRRGSELDFDTVEARSGPHRGMSCCPVLWQRHEVYLLAFAPRPVDLSNDALMAMVDIRQWMFLTPVVDVQ